MALLAAVLAFERHVPTHALVQWLFAFTMKTVVQSLRAIARICTHASVDARAIIQTRVRTAWCILVISGWISTCADCAHEKRRRITQR